MEIQSSLQSLGLHKYEASVYLALLELGSCNAGPLITKTGLHRVFVYNALESLEKKELVSHVVRRNRKLFQAAHPKALVEAERSRLKAVEELLPQLVKLQQSERDRLEVRVLYGKDEFVRNMETVVEVASRGDKIIRLIGGAPTEAFVAALGTYEDAYHRAVRAAGVHRFLIGPTHMPESFRKKFLAQERTRLRVMEHGLSSPTYTRITEELTTIEIYGQDIMVIQVWNRAVARGFLDHFNILWKKATAYTRR